MSHTPGPWVADEWEDETCAVNAEGRWHELATVYGNDDEGDLKEQGRANALLIAAAPELLAALREIVRGDVGATLSGSQCVEIAQTAIAKAEGK